MLTRKEMFGWIDSQLATLSGDRAEFVLRLYRNSYLAKDEVFDYLNSRGINASSPAAQTYIAETKLDRKNIVKASNLDRLFVDRTPMFRMKEEVDGTYGTALLFEEDSAVSLIGMVVLEEYGFVEVGDWLIGRTVQPSIIDNRRIDPAVFMVPAQSLEQFLGAVQTVGSLAGGFAYSAMFEPASLSPKFRAEYSVEAQLAFVATAYPEEYGKYDQFTRAKLVKQDSSERVIEDGR